MEGDDRKIGTDRLTGPDTGKVTGRRKPALTSHRTSQGRQRKPRKENATPAEANPGQAIAQNRPEAMQVCLGLTAMSAPFAFGGWHWAAAEIAIGLQNARVERVHPISACLKTTNFRLLRLVI